MDTIYNSLCVAGGASKCISAIGGIYYLTEKGYLDFVENYIGTSAGAMICYLLSIGYTPFELIHFLCKSNFIDEFQNLNLAGIIEQKGLINYYIVQEYLEKLTLSKIGYLPTFKDIRLRCGKNLTVVVYNLTKNITEYINADTYPDMPCLTAIRMTISVPLLFERFFYNNCEYIDGGLVDNFPIAHYDKPGNKIMGININPRNIAQKRGGYMTYLLQIAMIPYVFFHTQRKIPECADVIEIDAQINTFEFNLSITRRLDLFSIGYQTAKNFFEPHEPHKKEEPHKVEEHKVETHKKEHHEVETHKKEEHKIELLEPHKKKQETSHEEPHKKEELPKETITHPIPLQVEVLHRVQHAIQDHSDT